MNLTRTLFYAFLLVLISCTTTERPQTTSQMVESVQSETTFISDKETAVDNDFIDTSFIFPDKWNDVSDIRGVWTNLEKEKNTYIIYNPIVGNTPRIKVDENDFITIFWSTEGPSKFRMMNTTISPKGNEMTIEAENEDGIKAEFTARILDKKNKLVYWKFNIKWSITLGGTMDYKWVTTKKECEKSFKILDYKNSPNVKGEREFQPISID